MATDKKITELPVASSINATDKSVLVNSDTDYQFDFTTLLQFINSGLTTGANISFGDTLPQNNTGKNGDVFINKTTGAFAQKTAGIWSIVYTIASSGATDGTVLYGSSAPGSSTGNNNDTYINAVSGVFYKKSAGVWSQVFSMQTGPQGSQGANGANGTNGTNGKTVLNGNIDPSNALGTAGDFYINISSYYMFGPKTGGIWGAGISLIPSGSEPPEVLTYPLGTSLPIVLSDFQTLYSAYGLYPTIVVRYATGNQIQSSTIDFGTTTPPTTISIDAANAGDNTTDGDIIIIIKP